MNTNKSRRYKLQSGGAPTKPPFKKTFRPTSRPMYQSKTTLPSQEINPENITKLFVIIGSRDIDKIKSFVPENNKHLNMKNENGETVLHILLDQETAIDSDNEELLYNIIDYLIQEGVSVSGFNRYNITPLHLAAKLQYYRIVKLLLNNGAEANAKDSQAMTPLHYAVQGMLGQCKKKEKVGALIPKTKTDINPKEFEGLTNVIFDILQSEHFKVYIKHIKNSLLKLDEIYPEEFRKKKETTQNKIVEIMSGSDNLDSKKNKINNKTAELSKDIVTLLQANLQQSLNNLTIAPNQLEGWSPEGSDDIFQKIMEKKDIFGITKDLNDDFNKQWTEAINNITKIEGEITASNKGESYVNSIFKNLHDMVLHFQNTYLHNKFAIDSEIPEEKQKDLKKLIKYEKTAYIKFQEINLNKDYDFIKDFTKFKDPPRTFIEHKKSPEPIKRGTQEQQKSWGKLGKAKVWSLDEKNKLVGKDEDVDGAIIRNDSKKFDATIYNLRSPFLKQKEDNGKYIYFYYPSETLFATDQLKLHLDIINENTKYLVNVAKNNNNYSQLIQYISYIQTELMNTVQYIKLILSEENKQLLQKRTKDLSKFFTEIFRDHGEHPYSYSLEYAKNIADDTLKQIEDMLNNTKELYDNIHKYQNTLNQFIDLINIKSAKNYINTFYKELKFTENGENVFKDVYDNILPKLQVIEQSFENHKKKYIGKELKEVRKMVYEEYIPSVNNNSYQTYYGDKVKLKFKYLIMDDNDGENALEFTPYTVNNQDIPKSEPKIGFFCMKYKACDIQKDPPPIIPYGEKATEKNKVNNLQNNNLKDANPTLIGTIGYDTDSLKIVSKKEPVINSINKKLDQHLYILKYLLVQNIIDLFHKENTEGIPNGPKEIIDETNQEKIKKAKDELLDTIKKTTGTNPEDITTTENKVSMYVTIGKIADEIITSYMKKIINIFGNKFVKEEILKDEVTITDDIEFFGKDGGFKTNYSELTKGLYKLYTDGDEYDMNDISKLRFSAKLMENPESPTKQYPKYNENYALQQKVDNMDCYRFNDNIIDILVKNGARVDSVNSSRRSAIYDAIDQRNENIVEKLVSNRATSYNSQLVDDYNRTPIEYSRKAYGQHLNTVARILLPKPFQGLYVPILDNIVKELKVKDEYKNNIIRYIDITFPQMLTMYNNVFYKYAKNYINNFSYKDLNNLGDLLWKYKVLSKDIISSPGVPLITKLTEENQTQMVENSSTSGVLNDKKIKIDNKLNEYKRILASNKSAVENIDKEIEVYQLRIKGIDDRIIGANDTTFIEELEGQKRKLENNIKELEDKKTEIQTDIGVMENNIEKNNEKKENVSNIYGELKGDIKEDLETKMNSYSSTMDSSKSVVELYDDIFKEVFKNDENELVYKDHMLYNEMWKTYLNDSRRMKNITNIHLLVALLQHKLTNKMQESIDKLKNFNGYSKEEYDQLKAEFQNIKTDFNTINKLYSSVFIPTIKDYDDLPLEYNSKSNYIRKDIMDIYAHVIKHIVLSNFYLAIGKAVASGVSEQQIKSDDKVKRSKRILEITNNIMKTSEKYIIDELPIILVKHYLQVYEDDDDKHREIKSFNSLMEPIYVILKRNTDVPFDDDSSVIKNIKDNLVPYYQDVIKYIIENMQYITDNYNRLIRNEGKHVSIMNSLLSKASEDI